MSVLIKGIKIPKNCIQCEWHEEYGGDYDWCHACRLTGSMPIDNAETGRADDCPLEPYEPCTDQPEWNNHTVACLLAELFGDTCACNYNGIDEWLPGKCELLDLCPNPVGVACWEQYLKHRAERRTDE